MLLGRLGDCFGCVSWTFHANVSGFCLGAGFRVSLRVWRASRCNCGAAGCGAAGVGVGGSDCGTGAASGCCSVVVAVVGSVAAGAETAVRHANATRSGGQFGDPICNGVTRIAFLQNDSDFPGTYLFIPDPFLIAPGSDNGPKATNGE